MNERNEVDIANFLYLNSIDYVYDRDSLTFNLKDNVSIKYIDKAEGKKEDGFCTGSFSADGRRGFFFL